MAGPAGITENDQILLAYDGSDGAEAAVEAAGRLFPDRGADVVSVWQSVAAAAPVGNECTTRVGRGASRRPAHAMACAASSDPS